MTTLEQARKKIDNKRAAVKRERTARENILRKYRAGK